MLAIVGTVPDQNFPLTSGETILKNDVICIRDKQVHVNRGTPALLAAAVKTGEALGQSGFFAYLVGDIGLGDGSRRLYKHLAENFDRSDFSSIAFHYLQPDVEWHNRILFAIESMEKQPVLIADAGFMYAAKMSGKACSYDLFTPDVGELAFLADEKAPHPFYTRGFILQDEKRVPGLIKRAYEYNNSSRFLLVKGEKDYLADQDGIRATVDCPACEAMEAMGGTGDTLTGITAALIESKMEISKAAIVAAKVNRLAGYYARPTPATQIVDIIEQIPRALEEVMVEQTVITK